MAYQSQNQGMPTFSRTSGSTPTPTGNVEISWYQVPRDGQLYTLTLLGVRGAGKAVERSSTDRSGWSNLVK